MPTLNLILNTQESRAGGRPFNSPYNVQYIAVGGGGGSAGGDNTLEVGQAGSGGQVVTGSYCIQPFTTYPVVIGLGGLGGQRTATSPNFTGSNGGNTTFNTSAVIAAGGIGGKIQAEPTASFFAGNGAGASASFGNGGNGAQWTVNLPGPLPNNAGTGGSGGDYITQNYYGGGGAGFNVNVLAVDYIVIAGGGAGGGSFPGAPQVAAGGGGAGGIYTGSYAAQPVSQSYSVIVGSGGLKGSSPTSPGGNGNPSSLFGFEAQGGRGGGAYPTSEGGAAGSGSNPGNLGGQLAYYGGGGGGTLTSGSNGGVAESPNFYYAGGGGSGSLWVDGKIYGAGGGGAFTPGGGSIYSGLSQLDAQDYGRGGTAAINNLTNGAGNGNSGSVIIRYPGVSAKATGGQITVSGSYVYHLFTSSGTFTVSETPDLIGGGTPGLGGGGFAVGLPPTDISGSNGIANTGGGAGASYYTKSGSLGGDGVFVIRYEGVIVGATGGQKIKTDYYTYHVFTASGNFYSGEGNTENKMINFCP